MGQPCKATTPRRSMDLIAKETRTYLQHPCTAVCPKVQHDMLHFPVGLLVCSCLGHQRYSDVLIKQSGRREPIRNAEDGRSFGSLLRSPSGVVPIAWLLQMPFSGTKSCRTFAWQRPGKPDDQHDLEPATSVKSAYATGIAMGNLTTRSSAMESRAP